MSGNGRLPGAFIAIVRAYWQVCTLQRAPQDIPRSSALLATTALANLLISILINQLKLDFGDALLVAVLEFVVLLSLTLVLLALFRFTARSVQTLTALIGSGAVIGLLVLLLLLALPQVPALLRVAIFVWNLVVMGHILRHALNIPMAAGFVIALGYAMVLMQIIWALDSVLGPAA